MKISGKQKFDLAFQHKEGPLLFDLGGFATTGMHCKMIQEMRRYYGLPEKPIKILNPLIMIGEIDEDLKHIMGVETTPFWGSYDVFGLSHTKYMEFVTPWEQIVLMPTDFRTTEAEDGSLLVYSQGDTSTLPCARMPRGSYYFDAIDRDYKFDEDNYDYKDNLEEFSRISPEELNRFGVRAQEYRHKDDVVLADFGGMGLGDVALVPGLGLKRPKGIRTVEEWYISTAIRQDSLHKIFEYQTDIAIKNLIDIFDVIGNTIHAIYVCGADFGTQKGPFCSAETFSSLYAPYYRKMNNWIHSNTTWKTFKHTCGNVRSLIPILIDVGFDALNPIQWTANDMEKNALKKDFGKDIVFWGGGVDTQHTLPYGTAYDVYDEVKSNCALFAKNGGYIFNPIHNIQPMVPPQNVDAMVRAIKDYNEGH